MSYLIVVFKYFERYHINFLQVIVFNYITCVITGALVQGEIPQYAEWVTRPWFTNAGFLGCSFIFFLNLMGYITTHQGVSVTSIANKLSLAIPVSVSFYLYQEPITFLKITGIILSIGAVILSSIKDQGLHTTLSLKLLALPLLLFIGSGINDSFVKYAQARLLQENEFGVYNTAMFSFAALIGLFALAYSLIVQKTPFNPKAIIAGIALGVPNYFSIYVLLKAFHLTGWDSSIIFPINNIGVVALSTVVAVVLFKEPMSIINKVGLALSIIAIVVMIYAT